MEKHTLEAELDKLKGLIQDSQLRSKVSNLLEEPKISFSGVKLSLEDCPGGAYVHHAYKGGLIQHTVAVARLTITICDLIEDVYGGEVDRDTVISGALLHDIMKCYAYASNGKYKFKTSSIGEKVDHLTLLVAEMYRKEFPLEVIHVVAAHHGKQSPVKPKTIEALIVSIADLMDSELSRQTLRAAEYMLKEITGKYSRCNSSKEALKILRVKSLEGWEGVRRLVEKTLA